VEDLSVVVALGVGDHARGNVKIEIRAHSHAAEKRSLILDRVRSDGEDVIAGFRHGGTL
jgi:hypothetical protein